MLWHAFLSLYFLQVCIIGLYIFQAMSKSSKSSLVLLLLLLAWFCAARAPYVLGQEAHKQDHEDEPDEQDDPELLDPDE